jgi:hypothetical protein
MASATRGQQRPPTTDINLTMLRDVKHLQRMAKKSNKTLLDEQIMIRIPGPLRQVIELEAQRDGRPFSALARRILVEWAAGQVAGREQSKEAA